MYDRLFEATLETLYMVAASGISASLIGLLLGMTLYVCQPYGFHPRPWLYRLISFIVNVGRSVPFIILMIAIIPFTRWLVGTSIGSSAAIVSLTVAAIPFMARVSETAFMGVSRGLIEAGLSMGATTSQLLFSIVFRESLPRLIQGITLTCVTLVGYSAMAGAVGGGGLGTLAIHHGYQRFNAEIMFLTVFILVVVVQCLQWIGDWASQWFVREGA